MNAAAFGFALPIKYEQVQPGMLIVGGHAEVIHYGLAFGVENDRKLAVFWSSGEIQEPFVIDLADVHQRMGRIDGTLELQPGNITEMLVPIAQGTSKEGIYIASDGSIGLSVVDREYGQKKWRYLSFETGEDHKAVGPIAFPSEPALYIRQEGRRDRFELPPFPVV